MKNNFKKYIKKDLPCAAKWNWSTVRLFEGETQSCHRTKPDPIPKDFDSFHNTPIKIKTRKLMQKGVWPGHGCEYCKNIEDSSEWSDRTMFNGYLTPAGVPPELFQNSKAVRVTPTVLEIYFSNLCNMSCIYCSVRNSSLWNQEEKKFNGFDTNPEFFEAPIDIKEEHYQQRIEKMFLWLEKNFEHLHSLHILGGEPLIQDETFRVLEFIESRKKSNLERLEISSNLKVEYSRFTKSLDYLNKFYEKNKSSNVSISCSIDCWGKEQEYIRTGIDIDRWEKNFSLMVKEYPNIGVSIHNTITNIGIKTMADLMIKKNHYQTFRNVPIYHSFSFVDGKPYMHPRIFPRGFFDSDFDKMVKLVDNEVIQNRLVGFKKYINNCPYQPELIKKLKVFLDIIDRRRNLNWRETFPWLADFNEDKYSE